jgi:hypothetical protein
MSSPDAFFTPPRNSFSNLLEPSPVTDENACCQGSEIESLIVEPQSLSKKHNIEKLSQLLIQGSIDSVDSPPLQDGRFRFIVIGRLAADTSAVELYPQPAHTESDDDSEDSVLTFREEFAQVCLENEELKGHIGELQDQLNRI